MNQVTDQFEVLNGPEDGTQFPVARTPIDIGTDPTCGIALRLDGKVNPHHARLTAVSDGYRVRSLGNGRVRVNGKSAGATRSRIIRSGEILEVGNTQFFLLSASDGLASRSRGLVSESDFAWAVGRFLKRLALLLRLTIRTVQSVPAKLMKHWFAVLVVVGIVAFFKPGFRYWLLGWSRHWFNVAWAYVQNLISN